MAVWLKHDQRFTNMSYRKSTPSRADKLEILEVLIGLFSGKTYRSLMPLSIAAVGRIGRSGSGEISFSKGKSYDLEGNVDRNMISAIEFFVIVAQEIMNRSIGDYSPLYPASDRLAHVEKMVPIWMSGANTEEINTVIDNLCRRTGDDHPALRRCRSVYGFGGNDAPGLSRQTASHMKLALPVPSRETPKLDPQDMPDTSNQSVVVDMIGKHMTYIGDQRYPTHAPKFANRCRVIYASMELINNNDLIVSMVNGLMVRLVALLGVVYVNMNLKPHLMTALVRFACTFVGKYVSGNKLISQWLRDKLIMLLSRTCAYIVKSDVYRETAKLLSVA
jgi:hypothetical protein